jgi:putative Holliday junction resolvase
MNGRVLAVDPGEKRIGLALSDLSGTIANPFKVIFHVGRLIDAAQIAQLAAEQDVVLIVVGQALDENGEVGPAARKAIRMAEAIRAQSDLPVVLWDESSSTEIAREAQIAMGSNRKKRAGHLDELAATVILQNYLDAHPNFPDSRKV